MGKPTWATAPTDDDVADATWFLTLLGEDAHRLDVDPVQCIYPAKDLLRAARLAPLPKGNAGVRKWSGRLRDGVEIPPVLLVAGTLDRPAIVAEGYHRVCAAYLRDEATPVACHFLGGAQ
jgi:hypothetical protein